MPGLSADTGDLLRQISALLSRLDTTSKATHVVLPPRTPAEAFPTSCYSLIRKQVPEIVQEFLQAKQQDGVSVRYIETLRSHLHRFATAFRIDIDSIGVGEMETWLRIQPIGPRARNNMRASLITLFHYARKQGYLPRRQPTEADEIATAKDPGGKIGILQPNELARILAGAPPKAALFLSVGAFTGMRSSEILRLEWSDVNFERQFITVAAEKSKTATRRIVPILPNLMLWIAQYSQSTGSPFRTIRDASYAILWAKSRDVEWPNNALRHSYATYRLAATANAARVALEMGNSPQKLITNYRELADPKQAEEWFSIVP